MNDSVLKPFFVATLGFLSVLWARWVFRGRKIESIPAVGAPGIWDYYTGGFKYFLRTPEMVQEGCQRYPGRVFRVPRLFCWDFIVSGPVLINELASAPDTVFSILDGSQETLATDITLGPEAFNKNHLHVIRSTLTRNLGKCFPDMRDEISCAFEETLALDEEDWQLVHASPMILTVIARTVNRLFVGLPICRNQEYLKLAVQFAIDVVIGAQIINLLPGFLRPVFGPFISPRERSIRKGMKHLGSFIEQRLAQEKTYGPDWPGKPNDLISWLLEHATEDQRTAPAVVMYILATNFAAIHTSSTAFTHAFFDLIAHPSYILPMREEAEEAVGELGWTKDAVNRMHKIDSFLRESQRMHDLGPSTMPRKIMDPAGFTFSDGTHLPFGSMVYVAGNVGHFDPAMYADPHVFDGFRFSKMRKDRDHAGGNGVFNHHMVTTTVDHVSFGHGQHACPGRFFAATKLKTMLAHLLVNYDIRAEVDGVRPPDHVFGAVVIPNRKAKVWVRKRQ
ncbi:cytochrome P450 [Mycena capillaripes]|nr:cytochrome P450 [Mycena capillaripes]